MSSCCRSETKTGPHKDTSTRTQTHTRTCRGRTRTQPMETHIDSLVRLVHHVHTCMNTLQRTHTHPLSVQPTQSYSFQGGGGFFFFFFSVELFMAEGGKTVFDVGWCVGARSVEWRPQMHPASVCCGTIMGVGWEFRRGCPEFTFILRLQTPRAALQLRGAKHAELLCSRLRLQTVASVLSLSLLCCCLHWNAPSELMLRCNNYSPEWDFCVA